MTRQWMAVTLFGWLLFLTGSAWGAQADDEGQPGEEASGTQYVELGSPLVTNYDGGGRLKYLKTRVTLRVRPPGPEAIQRHLPYLRNQLVMLFSRQLQEDLTSTRGKDRLQREALRVVREALARLEGQAVADTVINLYFPEYVIQS
ncbi:MAG: flagellar basal body-associated FliL family protein [Pseudomonadota bacterium]